MKSKPIQKKHPRRRCIGRFLLILTAMLLAATATAAGFALYPYASLRMDMALMELPEINRPATVLAYQSANRAARTGELHIPAHARVAASERRIFVPYDQMPADLIHAFVAIEDKRFYEHRGVDVRRTAHAVLCYLGGQSSFGGSTTTQQLVKNLTGHDETTVDRKLREIFLSLDLERNADKEEILECYLNVINLAEGCRGVGAAAHRYFSQSPRDLTLAECATIAAITQNPARYNPIRHPAAARERRDLILSEMEKQGYITPSERDAAAASEVILCVGDFSDLQEPTEREEDTGVSSWYTDLVISDVLHDLCETYGYSRAHASDLIYAGGLTIESAMDEELQAIVEAYYADLSHFPVGEAGRPQSSFILMDPTTGDILAVAGAVGEKTANRLQNYATDTRRPAGSCIKPLSVYAPALEEGLITWATLIVDAPVTLRDGQPWPRNADGLYRGDVTVGQAVADSVNTVAVRLLEEVGETRAMSYLRDRFGMSGIQLPADGRLNDGTISSLALGQQSRGVTSRELTAAYGVFYDGCYRPPVSYHRVLDKDGHVLLENPLAAQAALSPGTAALMTQLLETVTSAGTAAKYITLTEGYGIACAGKTGTTQQNCDRRYVGYTPRLLAGVWMGYDYPTELRGISGNPCVRIWDDLLTLCEAQYNGAPPQLDFSMPAELLEMDFCPLSGKLTNPFCTDPTDGTTTEHGFFLPGTEPQEICDLHEEPPIEIAPLDPSDPDRIPLFPEDLSPDILPPEPDGGKRSRGGWFSQWFSRFSRGKV